MRNRKRRIISESEDVNPLHSVANLFDVSIVFAVALMVALVSKYKMTEMFSKEDFTMVKNPGKSDMQVISKKGNQVKVYKASNEKSNSKSKGKRVGVAYQLDNGEVIYVPE